MPADNQRLKQYQVAVAASSSRAVPYTAMRSFLSIQNTGANPGRVRFGQSVQNDGGDIVLAAFEILPPFQIPETCPKEAINFSSDLGTTFAVLEGITS